jgi:peptidoglycan hydrolase-like protein with peptidoglycan-binding domain
VRAPESGLRRLAAVAPCGYLSREEPVNLMARRLHFHLPVSAALLVVVLLLCLPATSFAEGRQTEPGESSATALSSAGLLARGTGFESRDGSPAVRALQVRLRRLGHRPGPIDGLFGPLTEGAVERFQRANRLAVDGIVGPQTRRQLVPAISKPPPAARGPATAPLQAPASPRPPASPKAPASSHEAAHDGAADPDGLGPGSAALLGALGAAVAAAGLGVLAGRRRTAKRRPPLNLGMVGAALLAVFVVGAAGGAVFATQAVPDDFDDTPAGGLRATSPERPHAVTSAAGQPRPRRGRRAALVAAAPRRADAAARSSRADGATRSGRADGATRSSRADAATRSGRADAAPDRRAAFAAPSRPEPATRSRPALPPTPIPAPPAAPPALMAGRPPQAAAAYTARPRDSHWQAAKRRLTPKRSTAVVARRVNRLMSLDLRDRTTSGDPGLFTAGRRFRHR